MAYTNIDDPSAHFQTALYAGNNTTDHNITNDGNSDLQPDFVWIKQRTSNNPHVLQDSSRGFAGNGEVNVLQSNSTGAEATNGAFESFNTNGFGVGGTNVASGAYNLSGSNYVAWQWKANGGTTSSNTDGSITSTVQANQDAGFSIVTYTGTGSAGTIGHGLGVAPKVVLVRARSRISSWIMFHKDGSTSDDDYLVLQSTAAKASQAGLWNNQYPSSTVFGASTDLWLNNNADTYIAYCFAEKQGYSKFGKYVGNGNADGTFIYTGFKPAFVIIKPASSSGYNWAMTDHKRNPSNEVDKYLWADDSGAEYNGAGVSLDIDYLSNGFKLKTSRTETNQSGGTYIYMAFAENPFVTSTGIPTTAR